MKKCDRTATGKKKNIKGYHKYIDIIKTKRKIAAWNIKSSTNKEEKIIEEIEKARIGHTCVTETNRMCCVIKQERDTGYTGQE